MGILTQALPREQRPDAQQQSTVKSPVGIYRGLFVGMTDPFEYVSAWANEKCRVCKGQGTGYNGEGECRVCHGTKKRTEQHVKLLYSLENRVVEEEEMTFKLSGPGMGRDGQPLSPSTLFIRLRTLSGMPSATEVQLDDWYSSLQKPIKIPCQVIVDFNKTGTLTKITNVVAPRMQGQPTTPAREVDRGPAHDDVPAFSDDDFEGLSHP